MFVFHGKVWREEALSTFILKTYNFPFGLAIYGWEIYNASIINIIKVRFNTFDLIDFIFSFVEVMGCAEFFFIDFGF